MYYMYLFDNNVHLLSNTRYMNKTLSHKVFFFDYDYTAENVLICAESNKINLVARTWVTEHS